jgi:hypothetical protein
MTYTDCGLTETRLDHCVASFTEKNSAIEHMREYRRNVEIGRAPAARN